MVNLEPIKNDKLDNDLDEELDDDFELDELDMELADELELDILTLEKPTSYSNQDELGRYLADLSQYPRISTEEELRLSRLVLAGITAKAELTDETNDNFGNEALLRPIIEAGQLARDKFINANYRLVVSIAKHFFIGATPSFTKLDIIQSGNLGLMKAVDRFDPTKGFKFSTYATNWITQVIRRDLINVGTTIRIPVHRQELINKIYKLEKHAVSPLTNEELATALNITVAQVEQIIQIRETAAILYLDNKASKFDDDTSSIGEVVPSDTLSPDEAYNAAERDELLHNLMFDRLTDREQYIISRRYGLTGGAPSTLEALGAEFLLSRERIRQIEAKAIRKLRSPNSQAILKDLLNIK